MNTVKSETTMAINSKTSNKSGLLRFLEATVDDIKDTNLVERINYTLKSAEKDLKNVLKNDLVELAEEAKQDLSGVQLALPVENQAKPKANDKESEKVEPVTVGRNDYADEEESKSEKKKTGKKKPVLRKKVEESTPATKAMLPTAKFFPEEIDHEDLGKLVAVPDKYHSYKEVFDAIESGKTLYFACYWTSRHIKEYNYAGTNLVKCPKKFPDDLDLLVACVPCETVERVWCMSQYTEAMFYFDGPNFEPVEDEDAKTGEKFKVRVSSGMEFEIYEPVEE